MEILDSTKTQIPTFWPFSPYPVSKPTVLPWLTIKEIRSRKKCKIICCHSKNGTAVKQNISIFCSTKLCNKPLSRYICYRQYTSCLTGYVPEYTHAVIQLITMHSCSKFCNLFPCVLIWWPWGLWPIIIRTKIRIKRCNQAPNQQAVSWFTIQDCHINQDICYLQDN